MGKVDGSRIALWLGMFEGCQIDRLRRLDVAEVSGRDSNDDYVRWLP